MPPVENGHDSITHSRTLDYATQHREAQGGAAKVRGTISTATLLMGITCVLLSLMSFWIMMANASAEPYYGTISKSEALEQVGLGCVLLTLWSAWCVALVVLTIRRKVHPAFCAALAWAVLAISGLVASVDGYLSDLITFQLTPSLHEGWQRPARAAGPSQPPTPLQPTSMPSPQVAPGK